MRWACTIERVIDGDTVDAVVDLGCDVLSRQRIRVAGIETAELFGSARLAGQTARGALADLVQMSGWWVLCCAGRDRWGRLVCRIVHPSGGWDVGQAMIDRGVAWRVSGRSRPAGWGGTRGPLRDPRGEKDEKEGAGEP